MIILDTAGDCHAGVCAATHQLSSIINYRVEAFLFRILIIAPAEKAGHRLQSELAQNDFASVFFSDKEEAVEQVTNHSPDLVLSGMDSKGGLCP